MNSFDNLPIGNDIKRAIRELGFHELFPIQAKAILPLLEGKNVIGCAETGTGKTAAFGVSILERVDRSKNYVQAIVLVPTRELALQVAEDLNDYGKYTTMKAVPIYGGGSLEYQVSNFRKGAQIVVGTPGRTIDHIKRRTLRLDNVSIVILDEADRMLDMGFIEDIEYILARTPRTRQTALFSATIPHEIVQLARRYAPAAERINARRGDITVPGIDQQYLITEERDKFDSLFRLLTLQKIHRAIIFCNTKRCTRFLARRLSYSRPGTAEFNGDMEQRRREKIIDLFRDGEIDLLVATDLAGRGLDILNVSHIINFDFPPDTDVYFHRIGRTGRAGRKGTAISIVTPNEVDQIRRVQARTRNQIRKIN